ncbi:MAG: hypothetical protein PHG80_10455 [Methanoregulaceae archaeon]|nr:hypothetical protein [Methanoregulaceae archaeon]
MTRPITARLEDLAKWIYFLTGFLYGVLFSVIGILWGAEPMLVGTLLAALTGVILTCLWMWVRRLGKNLVKEVGP